jgi:hypothetical protein
MLGLLMAIACTDDPASVDSIDGPSLLTVAAVGTPTRVVLTPTDSLFVGPIGGTASLVGRAFDASGAGVPGVTLKFWEKYTSFDVVGGWYHTTGSDGSVTVQVKALAVGVKRLILSRSTGTATRDSVWVKVMNTPPPPPPPPSTLAAIGVTPGAVALEPGASQQFAAVDTLSDGSTQPFAGTWSATGGSVTSGGLYQAGASAGSYRVIATEGGTADTAAVTLAPPPPPPPPTLAAIGVTPGAVALEPGASQQFAAVDTLSDGSTQPFAGTWSATGGSVTSGGLYQAGASAGSYEVIATEGGTADTAAVTLAPPPPPPPPASANCFDGGPATVTLSGAQGTYDQRSLASGTIIDAASATWSTSSSGAPVRVGGGSGICWHGGRITGLFSDEMSWSAFHDTYAFVGYAANQVVEDLRAHKFGDGVKWLESATDNWTVRRVHLSDMHDDCVETDWAKGGRIEDVLFEGCYVFLATRPRKSVSVSADSSRVITVDRAVVWMKPTLTTYDGVPNSTGAVFKVDNATNSVSPRMRLRNIVLRVDVDPSVGDPCLNPYNLVIESVDNVVVWTGSGDYPCLPLPQGWTLTRDQGVWDQAVADWKARHPEVAF